MAHKGAGDGRVIVDQAAVRCQYIVKRMEEEMGSFGQERETRGLVYVRVKVMGRNDSGGDKQNGVSKSMLAMLPPCVA